ncbi:AraC family transcriptional regulator [Marinobacterium mangrovicola]|uniref:AraC-like DNA-binding protein n=1 Tax=Marinobacterium mangrovicola TaxID=1476959 RepID=A0A4R1GBY5_9GAMM|nr:AraC family transcriptional regulator [Marinobacterium mangrovicola]TCK04251.1 AraC-like DNA-binding protein [Marinobacterium mangrovicola]
MTVEQSEQSGNGALAAIHMQLVEVIDRLTAGQEDVPTAISNLALFRREAATDPCDCMVEPSIVLVVQGAKQLLIGDQGYVYNTEQFLITSLDLPAKSQVLEASVETPSLGLVFKLDMNIIAELIAQNKLSPVRERASEAGAYLGTMTPDLLEPFGRLLKLTATPNDIAVLAPLIQREIHYRLLQSDLSARLWQIVSAGSQSQRIGRAIDWLKSNYDQPLRIDDLAAHVQMSSSSLHHYFRQLTAKSPLQYQKWLRLNEARRLMISDGLDAAGAAFQVGYESPSQFSREYSRLFGAPPRRDIEGLRQKSSVAERPRRAASA